MGRGRTGVALIGAAVALMVGGSVASAGTDPSVPEPSVPATSAPELPVPETSEPDVTDPVETSVPATEPTAPSGPETYTLTIELPDWRPAVDPPTITVGVVVDGTDGEKPEYVVGPVACAADAPCAAFELAPGEYDLRIDIEQPNAPDFVLAVLIASDSDTGYDVTIIDRDVTARFEFVGLAPPPLPPSTTTTTSVASGGPVPVAELPETGSNGRLGVVSLVLIGVGLGCVVAARRRPA